MKQSTAAIIGLLTAGSLTLAWSLLPQETRGPYRDFSRIILALTAPFFLYAASGPARPKSTMGPSGDGLIGFGARVIRLKPLQIEAQGTVWQGRLVAGQSVALGETVRIVGREGLTLLVEERGEGSVAA